MFVKNLVTRHVHYLAFISNRIDDINIRIYRDMSNVLKVKEKKKREIEEDNEEDDNASRKR